jgi:hypothetical protein
VVGVGVGAVVCVDVGVGVCVGICVAICVGVCIGVCVGDVFSPPKEQPLMPSIKIKQIVKINKTVL